MAIGSISIYTKDLCWDLCRRWKRYIQRLWSRDLFNFKLTRRWGVGLRRKDDLLRPSLCDGGHDAGKCVNGSGTITSLSVGDIPIKTPTTSGFGGKVGVVNAGLHSALFQ